ncbi:hypothetical protein EXIGLDRAFT_152716 [Exidia glandulosa HHB12029]|uniref:Uncharacterized protein n=1 Tax=Exidia glandulosa HHB12029 TaxID=1314781 RepID=A0A165QFK4_EXIGL|nr:hypothetical protein EXIGLDRAFT_152716 [Exidia glandulosa HHB12029]
MRRLVTIPVLYWATCNTLGNTCDAARFLGRCCHIAKDTDSSRSSFPPTRRFCDRRPDSIRHSSAHVPSREWTR